MNLPIKAGHYTREKFLKEGFWKTKVKSAKVIWPCKAMEKLLFMYVYNKQKQTFNLPSLFIELQEKFHIRKSPAVKLIKLTIQIQNI